MGSNLVIPPAFVRHLNGGIPKDIILKDYAGRQWHCRLEEAEGGNGCIKEGTLFPNLDINHVKKKTETEEDHTFGTLDHAREQKYSKTIPKRTKKPGTVVERKTRKTAAYVVPKNPYFVSTIGSKYSVDCGEVTRYPSEARDDCLR
ncbi:hypothetical protein ACOSQ2_023328 [Xanthoceras sorbifolium]